MEQNEKAWLSYYQSGALGKKLTNREVIFARRAFIAGRESAQQSVQSDESKRIVLDGTSRCPECTSKYHHDLYCSRR